MKVAYISFLYPNLHRTGGSMRAYHITKALDKFVDLRLYVPGKNEKRIPEELDVKKVSFSKKPFLSLLTFAKNVRRNLNHDDFDIIHSNSCGGVLTDIDVTTFHHLAESLSSKIQKLTVHLTAKSSRKVITVSDKAKEDLENIGYNNVDVVPNGIDPVFLKDLDENKKEELKKKYEIGSSKIILYVNSNFTRRKNLPLMLNAIKSIDESYDNYYLLMLGPKNKENYVRRLFRQEGVGNRLVYTSDIPQNMMPYFYAISDFLAMPSTREGFGLPLIEAVATRTPFVSLGVGIAPELEKEDFGEIAKNEEEFEEKCLSMLKDRRRLSPFAKKYIAEKYSWKKSASKLHYVYDKLLRRTRGE